MSIKLCVNTSALSRPHASDSPFLAVAEVRGLLARFIEVFEKRMDKTPRVYIADKAVCELDK